LIIGEIDGKDDVTDFVQWKIKSLCAQADDEDIGGKKSMENEKIKRK
jgi:hypothetical protein